jgi:hypothetical protein
MVREPPAARLWEVATLPDAKLTEVARDGLENFETERRGGRGAE